MDHSGSMALLSPVTGMTLLTSRHGSSGITIKVGGGCVDLNSV